MRNAVDSLGSEERLGEIGEILSRGVELLLQSRVRVIEKETTRNEELNGEAHEVVHDSPIIQMTTRFGSISTADVIEKMGMTRSTARRRLAEGVDSGDLVAEGKGRGARYRVASKSGN